MNPDERPGTDLEESLYTADALALGRLNAGLDLEAGLAAILQAAIPQPAAHPSPQLHDRNPAGTYQLSPELEETLSNLVQCLQSVADSLKPDCSSLAARLARLGREHFQRFTINLECRSISRDTALRTTRNFHDAIDRVISAPEGAPADPAVIRQLKMCQSELAVLRTHIHRLFDQADDPVTPSAR